MSRTVRVSTPLTTIPTGSWSVVGSPRKRPRLVFSPTRPQAAAGMRIDPPPSLPWAMGNAPDATRAAEPPEDPPEE